jgi:DNA repair protein SbcC/Rad50
MDGKIMFGKLFKKSDMTVTSLPTMNTTASKVAEAAQETALQAMAWESRLHAAKGDDAALLSIAIDAPVIDIKCAAVMALSSEDALKTAEREFRTHDRKVHRAAKQRYETVVAHRENNEAATTLIASAAALAAEPMIPANKLVELDRAWAALDHSHLDADTQAEYAKHWAALTAVTRERGDKQLTINRWIAEAIEAEAQLNATAAEVANGVKDRHELLSLNQAVETLRAAAPASDGVEANAKSMAKVTPLVESLGIALSTAQQVIARLAILDELEQPEPVVGVGVGVGVAATIADDAALAPVSTEAAKPSAKSTATGRWRALAAIADEKIAAPLNARFDEWQMNERDQRQTKQSEKKQKQNDERKAMKDAKVEVLATVVAAGEAAIAEGHLAEANKHLVAIDEAVSNGGSNAALSSRIEALQAEYARLKGWQHWGGGRVRDDLVQEAEALAKTVAEHTAEPEVDAVVAESVTGVDMATTGAIAPAADTAPVEPALKAKKPARVPKLPLKQHADAIENLRERWKECDRLGGATSRSLWQRFDGALKQAYVPVTAHLAKLKATRQENLEARNKLIATLDAVNVSAPASSETPLQADPQDFKELARALDSFQTEWRKLGPVEHTVPHKAREALLTRMRKSMARLEAPLFEARRLAQLKRDKLIERAKALVTDAHARDVIAKVRELQAEWQREAKAMPLARNVENAVWTAFKTATDAVFTQRDAAFNARDAELKASKTVREELIAKVAALNESTPVADIKRTLMETDTAWRRAGEAPRAEATKLDSQFRAAREAAQKLIASSAQRIWDAKCDALNAKLALCEELENTAATENIDDRYTAISALPNVWEQALAARLTRAKSGMAATSDLSSAVKMQEAQKLTLLQLESALDIASPAQFQAARRDLKLRAMKMAMEGKASADANLGVDKLMADALGFSHLDAASRERLSAILAALRVGVHRVG